MQAARNRNGQDHDRQGQTPEETPAKIRGFFKSRAHTQLPSIAFSCSTRLQGAGRAGARSATPQRSAATKRSRGFMAGSARGACYSACFAQNGHTASILPVFAIRAASGRHVIAQKTVLDLPGRCVAVGGSLTFAGVARRARCSSGCAATASDSRPPQPRERFRYSPGVWPVCRRKTFVMCCR